MSLQSDGCALALRLTLTRMGMTTTSLSSAARASRGSPVTCAAPQPVSAVRGAGGGSPRTVLCKLSRAAASPLQRSGKVGRRCGSATGRQEAASPPRRRQEASDAPGRRRGSESRDLEAAEGRHEVLSVPRVLRQERQRRPDVHPPHLRARGSYRLLG